MDKEFKILCWCEIIIIIIIIIIINLLKPIDCYV